MTGEEMERAIEFLLEGMARLESRAEQTDAQVAQLSAQVSETSRQLSLCRDAIRVHRDRHA
jgi:prefoldin subunit 5